MRSQRRREYSLALVATVTPFAVLTGLGLRVGLRQSLFKRSADPNMVGASLCAPGIFGVRLDVLM